MRGETRVNTRTTPGQVVSRKVKRDSDLADRARLLETVQGRLRELKARYSQAQLAKMAGVERPAVRKWFDPEKPALPDLHSAVRLCRAMGKPLAWLVEGANDDGDLATLLAIAVDQRCPGSKFATTVSGPTHRRGPRERARDQVLEVTLNALAEARERVLGGVLEAWEAASRHLKEVRLAMLAVEIARHQGVRDKAAELYFAHLTRKPLSFPKAFLDAFPRMSFDDDDEL